MFNFSQSLIKELNKNGFSLDVEIDGEEGWVWISKKEKSMGKIEFVIDLVESKIEFLNKISESLEEKINDIENADIAFSESYNENSHNFDYDENEWNIYHNMLANTEKENVICIKFINEFYNIINDFKD